MSEQTIQLILADLRKRIAHAATFPPAWTDDAPTPEETKQLLDALALADANIRVREESQIPMIPRGAQARIEHLEASLEEMKWALVDALKRAEAACAECGHIDWQEREVPSTYDTHENAVESPVTSEAFPKGTTDSLTAAMLERVNKALANVTDKYSVHWDAFAQCVFVRSRSQPPGIYERALQQAAMNLGTIRPLDMLREGEHDISIGEAADRWRELVMEVASRPLVPVPKQEHDG